jgi:hypothetical protein
MNQPKTGPAQADAYAAPAQAGGQTARLRAIARAAQLRAHARAARLQIAGPAARVLAEATAARPAASSAEVTAGSSTEATAAQPAAPPATPPAEVTVAPPAASAAEATAAQPAASPSPTPAPPPAAPLPADAIAALRRIRTPRPDAATAAAAEHCELCAVPVPPEHRHIVNLDSRALLCACRPCSLLFEHPEAKLAYRTVPDRHLALPPLPREQWDSLDVPVGLAFVFRNSRQGRTVVCYPGPAGATEADLPIDASAAFGEAVPDVEAVLIRAREDAFDRFVVPIDACYALVGHLRTLWRGFDGGPEAHARVSEFFASIERKAVRSA